MAKFAAGLLFFFFLGLHGVFKIVEATSDFQDGWHLQNPMDFDDNRFDTEVAKGEVFNESLATTSAGSNSECNMVNPIDRCWRCDPNWEENRQRLADCAIGFGKAALGGKNGKIYTVTDSSDDPVSPKQGTLRHAVIQEEPLWIIFARDMEIKLKVELIMNNYKTIDGRGANVHIAGGPCITIQAVSHIIIHGIHIHDCEPGGNMMVRSTPTHVGTRTSSDGDGISLFTAQHVWIDHCFFSSCKDGIIDAVMESTAITISNSYFTEHDKVMLFGHSDDHVADKVMRITVAFNRFGEGLIERIPACRVGYFHVFNNDYNRWGMYAVGGSANPTINSQGNRFLASANIKEVTKRMANNGMKSDKTIGKNWNWRSQGDLFLNGAVFTSSGNSASPELQKATSYAALPASMVPSLTAEAGVLICQLGKRC